MEEERKECLPQVKNKRLLYLIVFASVLFIVLIFLITLAGDASHPMLTFAYTLIGVLSFFVVLFVMWEFNWFSSDSMMSVGVTKRSVDLTETDSGDMNARSEIPYVIDVEPPYCPGDSPPDYITAVSENYFGEGECTSYSMDGRGAGPKPVDISRSSSSSSSFTD